ncbi:MAG: hypothetical protein WKF93_04515 [Acidimicrobiales bacterium]
MLAAAPADRRWAEQGDDGPYWTWAKAAYRDKWGFHGRHLFAVSMLSAMTVAAIVVVNPDSFDVLFRNVAIARAALSLAVHAREMDRRAERQGLANPGRIGVRLARSERSMKKQLGNVCPINARSCE